MGTLILPKCPYIVCFNYFCFSEPSYLDVLVELLCCCCCIMSSCFWRLAVCLRQSLTTLEIVYRYGLMAELIGITKVTHQAYTDAGRVITLACTNIPRIIIGNQQKKSVATMVVTFRVICNSSFNVLFMPERFEDLKVARTISM